MALSHPLWRRLLVDITPLRESPAYRHTWIGQLVSFLGTQMTMVALPVQVYRLTYSAFAVGLIGAVQLLPVLALGLLGGSIVDSADLRRVLLTTSSLLACGSGVLVAQAFAGLHELWLLYLMGAFLAALSAVGGPARSLLAPRLLPDARIPAASALTHLSLNVGLTEGPLLAGVLISWFGVGIAYSFDVLSFGYALYAIARLRAMPPRGRRNTSWDTQHRRRPEMGPPAAGHPYDVSARLRRHDLRHATSFVPGSGRDALLRRRQHGRPALLSPAIGALFGGVLSGPLGRIRRHGFAVIISIAIWGLA